MVGPISKKSARRLHQDVQDYLLKISNVHTSLRQASEWGMRGLQGTFPRFKMQLPSDYTKRRLVLETKVFIHNLQTEIVGKNQIKTVFDPEYERIQTLRGYDRIRQYYFEPGDYNTDDEDNDDDGWRQYDDNNDSWRCEDDDNYNNGQQRYNNNNDGLRWDDRGGVMTRLTITNLHFNINL